MSAVEVTIGTSSIEAAPRFHVVEDGEISARHRRRAFARNAARAHAVLAARTYAALGSIAAVFTAAGVTMVWAFLSIPNTPLP